MISEDRIYLTEDGEAVHNGDPRGVRLLVGAGCDIPDVIAEKYGLPLEVQTGEADASDLQTANVPGPKRKGRAPADGAVTD